MMSKWVVLFTVVALVAGQELVHRVVQGLQIDNSLKGECKRWAVFIYIHIHIYSYIYIYISEPRGGLPIGKSFRVLLGLVKATKNASGWVGGRRWGGSSTCSTSKFLSPIGLLGES